MYKKSQHGGGWWLAPEKGAPAARAVFLNLVLVLVGILLFVYWVFTRLHTYDWNWAGVWAYRWKFVQGWGMTLGIALSALGLSLGIGVLVALCRRSRILFLRELAGMYVELIRGSPFLVQILVLYYGVFEVVGIRDAFLAGVLILSIFSGAYIGEIVRGGIAQVGRTQWESAMAVGFTTRQTYRYIVMPQTLRNILPPLTGQLVSLIKDSSLLSIIAISELTLSAQEVYAFSYAGFESYLPLAAGYLLLTLPVSWLSRRLERKLHYEV